MPLGLEVLPARQQLSRDKSKRHRKDEKNCEDGDQDLPCAWLGEEVAEPLTDSLESSGARLRRFTVRLHRTELGHRLFHLDYLVAILLLDLAPESAPSTSRLFR